MEYQEDGAKEECIMKEQMVPKCFRREESTAEAGEDTVRIRIAAVEDGEELLELYRPYVENTAITFEYEVPSLEEFRGRMVRTMEKYPYLVAERQGKTAGYAYAGPFKERAAYGWSVETTVYVQEHQKKLGIGKKLYLALEKVLGEQNILNLNACIGCPREAEDPYLTMDSVRFHECLGYRMVGRFYQCGYKYNRWYDMVWMEKQIGPHLEYQPEVIPFPLVQELAEQKYGIRRS